MSYEYVVIGGGPTGLTIALFLGKSGKKCLLVDSNSSLGGCHRVTRVNGLFTEHGPRVYSSAYKNTKTTLLPSIGLTFDKVFTKYNFSLLTVGKKNGLSFRETLWFVWAFLKLVFNKNLGQTLTVDQFARKHKFSKNSKDYLDRLCRLSDGAGSDRYSLFQFLQLVNENALYKLYQPRKPLDRSVFKNWASALEKNQVRVLLNTSVTKMSRRSVQLSSGTEIRTKNIVVCVPPRAAFSLFQKSELLNPFSGFQTWVKKTSYSQYLPVVFHWNTKLKLPHVWGFPKSDWGIAFVVLTDYMTFENKNSKTVISTCITMVNNPTKGLGTANSVTDAKVLVQEVFRQLKLAFPNLPPATRAILHPGIKRVADKWIEPDSSYVKTAGTKSLAFQTKYPNIFYVGAQNGFSRYNFTSLESAITNALAFVNTQNSAQIHLQGLFKLTDLAHCVLWIIGGALVATLTGVVVWKMAS